VMMVILPQVSYAEENFIEQFGVTEGSPVNKGFVFLDGVYVESPYIISRRGLSLYVNNKKIEHPSRHPGDKPYIGNIDVKDITKLERQKLSRLLEATRNIYESYLEKGYCYFFGSRGGHIRLEPYIATYDLLSVIDILQSDLDREEKLKELTTRNWHLSINVGNIVDNFSVSPQLLSRLDRHAQQLLRVDKFGTATESPINTGFVFYDGQYLNAPYNVERKGLGIFVNDKMVERPLQWPVDVPSGDVDPELPSVINSETSIYDEVFTKYWQQKSAYLRKHHTRGEERQIMEQLFRKLPFVTAVKLDPNDICRLHVTTTEGRTFPVQLVSFRGRQVNYTREGVLQRVERKRKYFQDALENGSCCFLFSRGAGTRLSAKLIQEKLPRIVEILCSGKSKHDKFQQLRQTDINLSADKTTKFVNNFKASKQLEARLSKLTKPE